MSQLPRPKKAEVEAGFTLLEVMVALMVLTVGLMSIALLMANVYKQTVRSRYASLASMMATEKMEDLLSYGQSDPRAHLAGGTLTTSISTATLSDTPVNASWNGGTVTVDYYDTVTLNNSSSTTTPAMQETLEILTTTTPATVEYVTQSFYANGILQWDSATGPPYYPSAPTTTAPSGETFLRTWQIQSNTPATNLTTITVLVALIDSTMNPPVSTQISAVRP